MGFYEFLRSPYPFVVIVLSFIIVFSTVIFYLLTDPDLLK